MTWIFLVAAGLCALFYLVFDSHTDPSARRSASKTASVLLLSGLALTAGGPWLLVTALAVSAAGDFFLSRAGDRSFLLGMAAFFSAHLAYIWLMLDLGTGGEALLKHPFWLAGLLAMTAVIYVVLWPGLGVFRLPVVAYALAIFGMGAAALDLPTTAGSQLVLAGAALFILSDTVLSIEKFRMNAASPWGVHASRFVWVTYWLAQALLCRGLLNWS
jgi:uncharacterized membrane protein YhhN